jgi:hypothetical protein
VERIVGQRDLPEAELPQSLNLPHEPGSARAAADPAAGAEPVLLLRTAPGRDGVNGPANGPRLLLTVV